MLADHYREAKIDKIVAAEARGFVFGAPLAAALGCGFVMARKPGKLPREVVEVEYELEYGTDRMQLHHDSIKETERVLIEDDLMATGGTAEALIRLTKSMGACVLGVAVAMELFDLGGADRLEKLHGVETFSLIKFPGH